ncbi:MAG TPA: histidine kinase, partial [Vicinamibacteria bacterium]|nr:histidine kinase [Vicinamibacteria bacterium]
MQVPGYRIREELLRDDLWVVARAERLAGGQRVLLKAPLLPSPASIASLRREHDLLASLDVEGVARPRGLEDTSGALVFDDTRAVPLRRIVAGRPLGLPAFLAVARRLSAALAGIHRGGIVHRGLGPDSVFLEPGSERPLVLDFGAASRLPEEAAAPRPLRLPGDRLAYLAPEQTGRMNRVVDHRSDLYS